MHNLLYLAQLREQLEVLLGDATSIKEEGASLLYTWQRGIKSFSIMFYNMDIIVFCSDLEENNRWHNLTIEDALAIANTFNDNTQFELSGRLCSICHCNPCDCFS